MQWKFQSFKSAQAHTHVQYLILGRPRKPHRLPEDVPGIPGRRTHPQYPRPGTVSDEELSLLARPNWDVSSLTSFLGGPKPAPISFLPRTLRSHSHPRVLPLPRTLNVPLQPPQRRQATRAPTGTRAPGNEREQRRPPEYLHAATGREGADPGGGRAGRGVGGDAGERAGRGARRVRGQGPGAGRSPRCASGGPGVGGAGGGAALGRARASRHASRLGGFASRREQSEGRRSLALTSSRLGPGRRHLEELSFKLARSDGIAPRAGTPPPPPPPPVSRGSWGPG